VPLQNLVGELLGDFPRFPPLYAQSVINRAWTRIRDIRLWSWQVVPDAQIFAPDLIQVGTVSTTSFSTTITANSAAAAALNAAAAYPPIFGMVGVGRQIRIGVGQQTGVYASNGPYYHILNWDGTSVLTIDRPFGEGTVTGVGFQVFKAVYAAPSNPATGLPTPSGAYIKLFSLTNKNNGSNIPPNRLNISHEWLNRHDPQRSSSGDPTLAANYGTALFELYPYPVAAATYYVDYYNRWPDLSPTQDLPQVPYGLQVCMMDLAKSFACQWAAANAATFPELQQTNWIATQSVYRQDYADGLKQCLKQDDEMMPQLPFLTRGFLGMQALPPGGEWLQSHDIANPYMS
jgi:hypothetical protein